MLNGLKKRILDRRNISYLRKSKLFDEYFYVTNNPKVFGDPCGHYYRYGWLEGYDPSIDFNGNDYLSNYLDVKDTMMNPLLHYLKYGKEEGRSINKSNGVMGIDDVFQKLYHRAYSYHLYFSEEKKRVNLFIDQVDDATEELLKIITKYCKRYPYTLRIICDNLHELNVDDDVEVINYNTSNYLEVSLEDRYICTSWKSIYALLHTNTFIGNVFYYIRKIDDLVHTSLVCCDDRVTCLVNDPKILEAVQQYNYSFTWNEVPLKIGDDNYLYCDFGNFFVEGVEWLNQIFLNSVLDMDKWKVFILHDEDFVFHLDCGLCLMSCHDINTKVDLMISEKLEDGICSIQYSVLSHDYSCKYTNIKNNLLFDELNKDVSVKKYELNGLLNLIEKVKDDSNV